MTPRPRRVTAEHTRDRVRNNQRRHRARRKDYIATLEEKLEEAEKTIAALRSQVQDLEQALERDKIEQTSKPLAAESGGLDIQETPHFIDEDDTLFLNTGVVTEDHDSGNFNDTCIDRLPGIHIDSTDLTLLQPAMFPPQSRMDYSLAYQSHQSNSHLQKVQFPTTTNSCCSSLNAIPPNLQISPMGTDISAELTRLCCEAYILIVQQNVTIFQDETCGRQNDVPVPELVSCNFRMSCCLYLSDYKGVDTMRGVEILKVSCKPVHPQVAFSELGRARGQHGYNAVKMANYGQ